MKRRPWIVALRLVAGLAVLAFVVSRADLDRVVDVLADIRPLPLVVAFLAQAAAKLAWASRWRDILRANGIERSFRDLLALVFVGLFFNTFLPTSMGGDVVRGHYTGSPGKRASSYGALLVERGVGLAILAAIAAVAAGIGLASDPPLLPPAVLWTVGAVSATIALGGAVAFVWTGWLAPVRRIAERSRPKLASAVDGVGRAIAMFRRPGTPTARILAASFALQVIAVVFHLGCARAVGLEGPTTVYFVVVPVAVIAAMLPFTLNGLGLREGVLIGLTTLAGEPAAGASAFALLALVVSTMFSLVGGIVYPFYRKPETAPGTPPGGEEAGEAGADVGASGDPRAEVDRVGS